MPIILFILSALGAVSKHPLLLKLAFFGAFVALLGVVMDYFYKFIDFSLITDSRFFEIASFFGLIDALVIFIKISVSIFFARQFVSFFRN